MFYSRLIRFLASWCLLGLAIAVELHAAPPVLSDVPARRVVIAAGTSLTVSPGVTLEHPRLALRPKENLSLFATVNGEDPFTFLGEKDGALLPDATTAAYTSAAIPITVVAPPFLTTAPTARTLLSSSVTSFNLNTVATGSEPFTYTWKKNGRLLPGETTASLARSPAGPTDAGVYVLEVRDSLGQVTRSISHVIHVTPGLRIAGWGLNIAGWGLNTSGQLEPPAADANPIAVAAGGNNSAALNADGTVAAWGSTNSNIRSVPIALSFTFHSPVVAISVGDQHALALRADGTIVAWGDNSSGRLAVPLTATEVTSISAGYDHSLALRADGTVIAWGSNFRGQSTVPVDLTDVVAISAGYEHSLALRANGTVVAWGYNFFDQATVPAGLTDVVAIAASYATSHALRGDGTALTWGFGSDTTTAVGSGLAALAAGANLTLALRPDRTLVAWGFGSDTTTAVPAGATRVFSGDSGANHVVVLRDASADILPAPVVAPLTATILSGQTSTFRVTVDAAAGLCSYQWRKDGVAITGQTSPMLTVSSSGTYSVTVTNAVGTVLSADTRLTVIPPPALSLTAPVRQVLTPGQATTLGLTATGSGPFIYRWKHQGRVLPAAITATLARPSFTAADAGLYVAEVTDANNLVSRAIFHLVPAVTGSRLVAWGANTSGQLGTTLPIVDDLWAVAAGDNHALALRANGQVFTWGSNRFGLNAVPAGLSEVVAVAAGGHSSLALKADGTVVAWGNFGQTSGPGNASGIVGIAAGFNSSLALKADGTVLQWGGSNRGLPSGLTEVVALACGDYHHLALKADGTVVTWGGANTHGESTTPVGLGQIVAIAAGGSHSLALRKDGTVVAWGRNNHGQTGVPAGLRGVVAISAGSQHSLARLADGTVVAWGLNSSGQATPPATLQNVREISAGGNFSLAVRDATRDGVPTVSVPATPIYVTLGAAVAIPVETFGGNLVFAWTKDGFAYPAATGPTLRLSSARTEDTGNYAVTTTNASGSATSLPFMVEVLPPPSVTIAGPVRIVLTPGDTLALSATASGQGALTYRWFKDGILLPGTSTTFTLPAMAITHTGRYEIEVTNARGGGQSRAFVWVFVSPPQQQVVVWGDHTSVVPADLGRVIMVSAGYGFTMALRADGTVAVWGPQAATLGPIPEEVRDVVAIAAGRAHCLALLSDGTLQAWGDNTLGQLAVPTDGPFIAIAAAARHSVALRASGTAVNWGKIIDRYVLGLPYLLETPSGLRDVIAVAAGEAHCLALVRDGMVSVWGVNRSPPFFSITPFPSFTGVTSITAGAFNSAGLRADGTFFHVGNIRLISSSSSVGPLNALVLSSSFFTSPFALARSSDGSLVSLGHIISPPGPVQILMLSTFRDVSVFAAGQDHAVLVRDAASDQVPLFTTTPSSQRIAAGTSVTFTATAPDAIYHRWYRNGTELIANNRATLSMFAGVGTAEGDYTVHAISGSGETTTASFRLDFIENFAAWRARGFTNAEQANLALSGPLAVSGPDDAPNLLKYALGAAARSPLGTPGELFREGSAWSFIYDRPSDRPDVTYSVETSTDLQTWTTLGVEHVRLAPPENGWETWQGRVPGEVPKRFYRLRVGQPAAAP